MSFGHSVMGSRKPGQLHGDHDEHKRPDRRLFENIERYTVCAVLEFYISNPVICIYIYLYIIICLHGLENRRVGGLEA